MTGWWLWHQHTALNHLSLRMGLGAQIDFLLLCVSSSKGTEYMCIAWQRSGSTHWRCTVSAGCCAFLLNECVNIILCMLPQKKRQNGHFKVYLSLVRRA
jgi:hypothetical protein